MPRYANVTPLPTQTVTLLASKNPKRPGTAAHARFAKYRNGATVAACIKAGILVADLKWDLAHGFIKLAGTGQPSNPAKPAKAASKPAPAAPAAAAPAPAAPTVAKA